MVNSTFSPPGTPVVMGLWRRGHRIALPSRHRSDRASNGIKQPIDLLEFLALIIHQPEAEVGNTINLRHANREVAGSSRSPRRR